MYVFRDRLLFLCDVRYLAVTSSQKLILKARVNGAADTSAFPGSV